MNVVQNGNGNYGLTAREYEIAPDTSVKRGAVVKLSQGRVVLANAGETADVLGIAAENHSGEPDALDMRSDGKKILVFDAPDIIFECAAPVIRATGGTSSTLVTNASGGMAAFAADAFNGGFLKLFKKADGSTNTDAAGVVRRIEDFSDSSGTETFTVEEGGEVNANDEYFVFPPLEATLGNLSAERTGLVLTATAALSIKVVGHDLDRGTIKFVKVKSVL